MSAIVMDGLVGLVLNATLLTTDAGDIDCRRRGETMEAKLDGDVAGDRGWEWA